MTIGRALRRINPAAGWALPANTAVALYSNHTTGGGLWEDQSGNGNHATLVGGTLTEADGLATSSTKYASIAQTPTLTAGGIVCAWVKPNSTSGNPLILGAWTGATEYLLAQYGTMGAAGYNNIQKGIAGALSAGTWTHLALLFTGTHVYCYADGSASASGASGSISSSQAVYLGRQAPGASYKFDGQIDGLFFVTSGGDEEMVLDFMDNAPGSHAA
jgi:hypothetical protein